MYKLNYFNFKKSKNGYVITNDLGKYSFLTKYNLEKIIKQDKISDELREELIKKGFIYEGDNDIFSEKAAMYVRNQKNYILSATSLHIFVVTKNCNFNCIYCQAGNLNRFKKNNMSKEIAKKSVDIALQSPCDYLTFEFQGGEPLLNFEVIKYIVEYAEEVKKNKVINYNIVTNLSLLTDEMIRFFKEYKIMISTSIDGNEKIQNINRPFSEGNSYICTIDGLKKLKENEVNVSAIQTTTKYSLNSYKQIVDEYIKLGFNDIFVRPLTQLGKADKNWKNIGYSPEEYIKFYRNILEYIILLNKKGIYISERHTAILLKKIIKNDPVNYMELRSPCGGVLGQLAYYYNGDIYTCDEARMLSEMGDKSFKLGDVLKNNYNDIISNSITDSICISSCLECLSQCSSCAYMPYCGTCPVVTYAQENNIFSRVPENYRCKIYKGMIETIFEYLQDNNKEIIDIFNSWLD